MPTTPGVIRLTTPATLVTGAPPAIGIGAPLNAGPPFSTAANVPPDITKGAKTRFITAKTLEFEASTRFSERRTKSIGSAAYLTLHAMASRYLGAMLAAL
jgi:hypothetical protein